MYELWWTLGLVALGYTVGSQRERQHYKSLSVRENTFQDIGLRSNKRLPKDATDTKMIMASVVIATDYFKNVATNIKNMIGGGLHSQELLMDRAKREATIRLREKAAGWGAKEVFGFRIDTVALDGKGIEVFVYGTAVKR
jgi:uncharacterized protein YbjQ (UPF0145 family)